MVVQDRQLGFIFWIKSTEKLYFKEVTMIKVKCILGYYDTKLNRSVAIDEELEVTEDRAKQLIKAKVVEVTTTTPKEVAKKTRVKKEV